ncbi:MAG: UDP-3-O-(3-hydroxymyristoyl)glucosamine N-acyltransferase [Ignavibacteriae bacterium]|nr:UDP-3-O-(3-hydroxymyristoyl)glucosamine N-acyltransferase [Ignavibacteriota bacterium]
MKISVREAAYYIGGTIFGDENLSFNNVAKIEEAENGDLTFLYLSSYEKYFSTTKASVIIVKPDFKKTRDDITYIQVENPNVAFQKIIIKYFNNLPQLSTSPHNLVVSPTAVIGKNVKFGNNVVIKDRTVVEDNSFIFDNTVILEDCFIGEGSIIYPNVSIREKCSIGKNVIIHSGVVIGSDGFGFTPDEKGVYFKVPQIGNVIIEDNVEIGANTAIDRAAMGSTVIKRGSKIDNLVQIGHNVIVGENTVISGQTGISGSTKIGNNSILAGQVGLAGHLEIGDKVIIGAQSGVSKSITKPGMYFGYPAKEMAIALRTEAHIRNLPKYAERIKDLENKISELEKKINKE